MALIGCVVLSGSQWAESLIFIRHWCECQANLILSITLPPPIKFSTTVLSSFFANPMSKSIDNYRWGSDSAALFKWPAFTHVVETCHGSDSGSESVNSPGSPIFWVNTDATSTWTTETLVSWRRGTLPVSNALLPTAGTVRRQRRCVKAETRVTGCRRFWIVLYILTLWNHSECTNIITHIFILFSSCLPERPDRMYDSVSQLIYFIFSVAIVLLIWCTLFTYLHTVMLRDKLCATWWGKRGVHMVELTFSLLLTNSSQMQIRHKE